LKISKNNNISIFIKFNLRVSINVTENKIKKYHLKQTIDDNMIYSFNEYISTQKNEGKDLIYNNYEITLYNIKDFENKFRKFNIVLFYTHKEYILGILFLLEFINKHIKNDKKHYTHLDIKHIKTLI